MEQGGLLELERWCDISRHPEVWVLVDGARDQARHVFPVEICSKFEQ